MCDPIFEPELNFLPHCCPCGARFQTRGDLDLHKREICKRRLHPAYREPHLFVDPFGLVLPGGGVADGGRRT